MLKPLRLRGTVERPSREDIDRMARASLMMHMVPTTFTDGALRFDPATEDLIKQHVDEMDRLWSQVSEVYEQLARDTSIKDTLDCCMRYGVTVDEKAIADLEAKHAAWPDADRKFAADIIAAAPTSDEDKKP